MKDRLGELEMKIYAIEGMSCGGCARAIKAAIGALHREAEVEVDLERKQLRVEGFDDEEAISQAIEEAGFDLL